MNDNKFYSLKKELETCRELSELRFISEMKLREKLYSLQKERDRLLKFYCELRLNNKKRVAEQIIMQLRWFTIGFFPIGIGFLIFIMLSWHI